MKLTNILKENDFDIYSKLNNFDSIKKTIDFQIDGVTFELNATLSSIGALELRFTTPITSFGRSFTIEHNPFKDDDDEESLRVFDDFSLNINKTCYKNRIVISKFNILMAEFLLEVTEDEAFKTAVALNFKNYYEAVKARDEKAKIEKEKETKIREEEFNRNFTMIGSKIINKTLREMRDKSIPSFDDISKIFSIACDDFRTAYIRVTYSDGVCYLNVSTDLKSLTGNVRKGNKTLLKDAKERLSRAYLIEEILETA